MQARFRYDHLIVSSELSYWSPCSQTLQVTESGAEPGKRTAPESCPPGQLKLLPTYPLMLIQISSAALSS